VWKTASCTCAACGDALVAIGEDSSEQLDCEPARFFVRKHIYPTYACRACETITVASVPPAIIERGRPAPGLLAHVLVSKYADHLPLYRQSQIATRSGVELPRSTLADWVSAAGAALAPLVAAMRQELLCEPVVHADETPVAMLDPGAGQTRRAYLFAYRSATPERPITIFDFCPSRSGEHARRFLGDWKGTLMSRPRPVVLIPLHGISTDNAIAYRSSMLTRHGSMTCAARLRVTPAWPRRSTTRSNAGPHSHAALTMAVIRSTITRSRMRSDQWL
jgi:transposase